MTTSPAISPHTPTQMLCRRAASTTKRIRLSTAGWVGWYNLATRSFVRSAASVYWVKSFVPMLKNCTIGASRSTISAAEGTSIIAPASTSAAAGTPAARNSSRASPRIARAADSSSRVAIIGNITRTLPPGWDRQMARSCTLKISGRSRQYRIARQPRKGFCSGSSPWWVGNLSPPRSSVRMMARWGRDASTTCR